MRICVFGLGEAGSRLASDLVLAGAYVQAFDPAEIPTPEGVVRYVHPALAVRGSDLVMAVTAASDAKLAFFQAFEAMSVGTTYADLSTADPNLMVQLADVAQAKSLAFADVALMRTVRGYGLATPTVAAGPGAAAYAEMINSIGGYVDRLDGAPGSASAKKLLRSVMLKGTAAVLIEALRAGAAADDLEWLWGNLVDEIDTADETWLEHLVEGATTHTNRRLDEMRSALGLLDSLDVPAPMTEGTIESLRALSESGTLPFGSASLSNRGTE